MTGNGDNPEDYEMCACGHTKMMHDKIAGCFQDTDSDPEGICFCSEFKPVQARK